MALWLVRAGSFGESEELALTKNIAVIGWEELPDLSGINSREDLWELLEQIYPNNKKKTLQNWQTQIWGFINGIQKGDLIALPLKSRPMIAFGRVQGSYQYREDLPPEAKHTRSVEWITELPRGAIAQDILYSLGAFLTVCRIQRNNAEERIISLLEGRSNSMLTNSEESNDAEAIVDLEEYSRDQIRSYISKNFKGHELTRLVAAILQAQGYQVKVSPEGPDGGIDIIAGKGPLGFDPPRLAVQVKSSELPVDVKVLRELQGVMKNFGAEQGLFVSWGGYKKSVLNEAARLYFEIRLWESDDIIQMLQKYYDQLPEEIKTELPMKRVWTLVLSEE
ncbi:restriction endonuclease [Capillibacterium thermochitinicola]|uniref:Restriction endonuclease n=1 Tax=Capillibacterium thermochitinicola TaxID=2699427 RepID=A0A8J6I3H4_9FIRM|nr:restriction endonuclease [Capillibacterium thermochitinicola]MBA2133974.1 restriction endonuclease [Capillibacterium thermochitinicola]